MPRLRLPFFVMSVLPLVAAGTIRADAQDSRAAIITAQQAEKAAKLTPYVAGAAERTIVKLQREFLQDPNGFYPLFASVYSGGGFTLGGGYRRFYGDRTHADLKGMYSIKATSYSRSAPIRGAMPTDVWTCTRGRAGATPRRSRSTVSAWTPRSIPRITG